MSESKAGRMPGEMSEDHRVEPQSAAAQTGWIIYFLLGLSKYFFGYFKNSAKLARFEAGRADNARGQRLEAVRCTSFLICVKL